MMTFVARTLGPAAILLLMLFPQWSASRPMATGATFPTTRGQAEDGRPIVVPAAEGWTVVVFWASWCPPCLAKLGDYDRLRRDLADRQVLVMGISLDTDAREVARTAKKYGVRFPVLHAPAGRVTEALTISELPLALVIDPRGTIRFTARGDPRDMDRIHAIVARPPGMP